MTDDALPLEPSRSAEAVQVLIDSFAREAFWNYVLQGAIEPDRRVLPVYRMMVRYCLEYGHGSALEAPDQAGLAAVALWLPGDRADPSFWNELRLGGLSILAALGPGTVVRLMTVSGAMARIHEQLIPVPHAYLWALGVVPSHQGQGLGGRLLQAGLRRLDDEQTAAYLETHEPRNVPLYERSGFAVSDVRRVHGGLKQWSMIRAPGGAR